MGQATIDLPDPAQKSTAPISSADDLLSQLAGQEIDRLLADADQNGDVAAAPAANGQPNAMEEIAALGKMLPAEKLDAIAPIVETPQPIEMPAPEVEHATAAATPPTAAQVSAAATDEAYAEEVDKLIHQLNAIPNEVGAPVDVPNDPTPASAAEEATSTAERAALEPASHAEAHEPAATVQQILDEAATPSRIPFYVRGLELLNMPFSFCPDEMRDTFGKVAILTMMNSIGVLLYVILFRKH